MFIEKLYLNNYRSWKTLKINFNSKNNIIFGKNGQGKTSIVEAINYISTKKSYKSVNKNELIKNNSNLLTIKAYLSNKENNFNYGITLDKNNKQRYFYNEKETKTNKHIIFSFLCVLFSPYDTDLINLSPANRREFLDFLLCQTKPKMINIFNEYNKIIKQKNALLKNINIDIESLNIWNEYIYKYGALIIYERISLIQQINNEINNIYNKFNNKYKIFIKYKIQNSIEIDNYIKNNTNTNKEENIKNISNLLQNSLLKEKNKEVIKKYSLLGPHLDDLEILLGENKAKGNASTGEIWNIAISLKLASYNILKQVIGYKPILILDDVFSQIDNEKAQTILDFIKTSGQTFITTVENNFFTKSTENSIFQIKDYKLIQK